MSVIDENLRIYKRETELASTILRRNRYSTVYPYEWFGPDPEPTKEDVDGRTR